MLPVPPPRARLARMLEQPDLNLAAAALLIAQEEYPELDLGHYLAQLDGLATALEPRLSDITDPHQMVGHLNQFFFAEQGFTGNTQQYYDPRNSFLNQVLDRRIGIPITLSLVYLEVGWRRQLPLTGVGLPGHFLVSYQGADPPLLIDPFHGGVLLSPEDCQQLVQSMYGEALPFQVTHLSPVSKQYMLTRLLYNLKGIYLRAQDYPRALAVVERLLLLDPSALSELRDRGVLYYHLGYLSLALADFERFLAASTNSPAADAVSQYVQEIKGRIN
ncbi:MAG: tetratricopeptide repeat protein [Deinococcus sp.]|nr:tetratricopeptide repeat protein [Deinococcus sp.]